MRTTKFAEPQTDSSVQWELISEGTFHTLRLKSFFKAERKGLQLFCCGHMTGQIRSYFNCYKVMDLRNKSRFDFMNKH